MIVSKTEIVDFLGRTTGWTDAQRGILLALAGRVDPVPMAVLADDVFPNRTDSLVGTQVHRLRAALEDTPYHIERLTGYRLVRK